MDKESFKTAFISTFLATWAANNYADIRLKSNHFQLMKSLLDDADTYAEAAWHALANE